MLNLNSDDHYLSNNINSIALIDLNRIKFLTEKNGQYTYVPVEVEGLPKVPIIVEPKTINNKDGQIYELRYKLLLPNIELPSLYTERYINDGDINFEAIPNSNNEELVVYDNEDIHTIRQILSSKETTMNYIVNHRRQIYELSGRIISQLHNPKTKTLK